MKRTEFIDAVRATGMRAIEFAGTAVAAKGESNRIGAALGCTVCELFIATMDVLSGRASGHAMTLARSILEAQVDMRALSKDRKYLMQMQLIAARKFAQAYGAFLESPDLQDVVGDEERQQVANAKRLVEELRAKGVTEANVLQRFELADQKDDYRTAYGFFCTFAHNDVNALSSRHVRGDSLVIFDGIEGEPLKMIAGLCLETLARAVQDFPTFTSNLKPDDAQPVLDEVSAAWAKLQAEYPSDELPKAQ